MARRRIAARAAMADRAATGGRRIMATAGNATLTIDFVRSYAQAFGGDGGDGGTGIPEWAVAGGWRCFGGIGQSGPPVEFRRSRCEPGIGKFRSCLRQFGRSATGGKGGDGGGQPSAGNGNGGNGGNAADGGHDAARSRVAGSGRFGELTTNATGGNGGLGYDDGITVSGSTGSGAMRRSVRQTAMASSQDHPWLSRAVI